jgi:hypothetical protein
VSIRHLAAASLGVLALSGCAERSDTIDVSYDGECVVELEFSRGAAPREVDAFTRQVEGIAHVDRVQLLSRAGNIARFREALRRQGTTGRTFERLLAIARRHAGRVLLVKADDDRHVQSIIGALRTLPAAVTSMAERNSCHRTA